MAEDYGIKIAKAQDTGILETDPKKYEYWSKYQSPSLFAKVTTSITLEAGQVAVNAIISHNLGYYPHVRVFAKDCGNRYCKLPYALALCNDCEFKVTQPYFRFTYRITDAAVVLMISAGCWDGYSFTPFGTDYTFNPVDVFIFREKVK